MATQAHVPDFPGKNVWTQRNRAKRETPTISAASSILRTLYCSWMEVLVKAKKPNGENEYRLETIPVQARMTVLGRVILQPTAA